MNTQHRVAVVILNYNGKKHLETYLPSVVEHTPDALIVVADNASTDDSVTFLQNHYPAIQLIQLPKNYGFCDGYNKALAQIQANYYVLLNSDIEVTAHWLSPLLALLESNHRIGACQPTLRAWHDKEAFEYAGAAGGHLDIFGFPFCRGRIFDTIEKDNGQYSSAPIFWASGACLCIRAELYHRLAGLESLFFAHMEEIDLCWRIQNAGYSVWHCAESVVYHLGGGTLHKSNPRKTFLNFRNGLGLLLKNLPLRWLVPVIFIRLCLDGIAGIRFALQGNYADTWAIIKAHFAFYQLIPALWKNRLRYQYQQTTNIYPSLFYQKPIIWSYFFEKKITFKQLGFRITDKSYET